jgi:hypothetical protein
MKAIRSADIITLCMDFAINLNLEYQESLLWIAHINVPFIQS